MSNIKNGAGPLPADIRRCQSCSAEIVFVRTRNGKRMPVNVLPTDPKFRGPNAGELDYVHGEHQSHFATCDDPQRFRSE